MPLHPRAAASLSDANSLCRSPLQTTVTPSPAAIRASKDRPVTAITGEMFEQVLTFLNVGDKHSTFRFR
jgi:hypothetical protein